MTDNFEGTWGIILAFSYVHVWSHSAIKTCQLKEAILGVEQKHKYTYTVADIAYENSQDGAKFYE